MNANPIAPTTPQATPRFDAKFIEEHHLIDRYLEHKLPFKGARELENWCRDHPDYLEGLKLSERTQASLELLEACGKPIDLTEPKPPWWKSPYLPIGSGAAAMLCLLGFWVLFGKYVLLKHELEDTRTLMHQGSLEQPAIQQDMHIAPDKAPDLNRARIVVNRSAPQLIDLHIDLGFSKQPEQYRMLIDKQDQGRALILNNLLKDSNGELRLTFNTTGLAAGIYSVRIESLPFRGSATPVPEGWMILDVR